VPTRSRDRQPRSNLLATLAELPGPVGVGAIRRGVPAVGSVRWATVVPSKPMTMGIVLVASLAVSMALAETATIVGAAPISLVRPDNRRLSRERHYWDACLEHVPLMPSECWLLHRPETTCR
jgi:hypothetical protein